MGREMGGVYQSLQGEQEENPFAKNVAVLFYR